MNKHIEALKMAIEALDNACMKIEKWTKGGKWTAGKEASDKCKEALAEAEQKQKQGDALTRLIQNSEELGGYDMQPIKPIVTAPSITISNTTTIPATWQSLSDDEIDNIWSMNFEFGFRACARAIEQALKEKNT